MKKKISITIDENLLDKIDSIVDNIFIRNRSQAIEYLASQSVVESRTAIILAGGNEENRKIKSKYRFEYTIANIVKKLKANSFNQIYISAILSPSSLISDLKVEDTVTDIFSR